ncbi:3-dehydroquinate synthase [Chloroflexota bacterium]
MRQVEVGLGSNSYKIGIGAGLLQKSGRLLKENGLAEKLAVITNPVVDGLYGEALRHSLTVEGFRVKTLTVPDGEEQKSLEVAGGLYAELVSFYAERSTPILALGGGVIGDLAGFVAATYLRGVPLVQIPTTLLAQVDSSIGGKVAVDLGQVKNIVGAFYQPGLVISDISTLKTLPAAEFANGLAEVIKYGMACDREFFHLMENNLDRVKARDEEMLEEIVFRSARIKAGIVEQDEKELGLRAVLNYGHTIGHGIESASDFTMRHGEAVAVGMLVEAEIAIRMGILDRNALVRLKHVVQKADLPTKVSSVNLEKVIQAMGHDKKVLSGKMRFVLPRSVGEAIITDEVSPSLVEQVLADWDEKT